MKRYDSYKDSGVEWIGEIPINWRNLNRISDLMILRKRNDLRE